MQVLNNVETLDDFDAALTLEQGDASSLVFVVANASARVSVRPSRRETGGDQSYSDELLVTPSERQVLGVNGAKFRSAVPGEPARVVAILAAADEPQFAVGVPFLETLAGSGLLVPDAMTPYVPSWTSDANPQPDIVANGGTLTGFYAELGALVLVEIHLALASGLGLGTGAWFFSLPTAVAGGRSFLGDGIAFDSSAVAFYPVGWRSENGVVFPTYQGPLAFFLSSLTPFAWAAGDTLDLTLVYAKA